MSSSGRDRAKVSPFWATGLQSMQPGPRTIVQGLHGVISRSPSLAPFLWMGSGWRTGSAEHASGRSIDIMITADTGVMPSAAELSAGNSLVVWLIGNAAALGVHGIIFSRDAKRRPQIWGYSAPGRWRDFPARGSISGDHVDHVHVIFKAGASWPSKLSAATIGGGTAPVKPAPVKPAPVKPAAVATAPKLVPVVSVAALKAARYADPPKTGTPLGPHADQVYTLETALAKTGWLRPQYVDGHYGTTTVGDGSSGYGGTTGFQRKHSGAKTPDGWLGAKELAKLFALAKMSVRVEA